MQNNVLTKRQRNPTLKVTKYSYLECNFLCVLGRRIILDILFGLLFQTGTSFHKIQDAQNHRQYYQNYVSSHFYSPPLCFYFAISEKVLNNVITAGPRSITKSSGKINRTKGKTRLTEVLWADSSAIWRRLTLNESAKIRSELAMLVPNLSACISITAKDRSSSTPVLRADRKSVV